MLVHVRGVNENVRQLSPFHQVATFLFKHCHNWIVIM
jgi:hypothetical protein